MYLDIRINEDSPEVTRYTSSIEQGLTTIILPNTKSKDHFAEGDYLFTKGDHPLAEDAITSRH